MMAVVTFIVVLGVAVVFLTQNQTRPLSTPYLEEIVKGTLLVDASSYASFNFSLPSGVRSANVMGTFTVSEGMETIKVYIFDSAGFMDWQNSGNASSYYNSGEMTSSNITATLVSPGTYYLVYDNTFSLISKNVTTQVNFYYIPNQQ
ncbi:MAG: hypothetical protein NWE99_10195 [Candidatus Bathyarchaeota archaeon]|nr:hypothetical protein [Candidatus Bathyarchaeota archaeon]